MNLNDSSMNAIEHSTSIECSLEESTLNKNVNFSRLDLSKIVSNESTKQRSTKNQTQNEISTAKLSITLEQGERDMLRNACDNGSVKNLSHMDISTLDNGTAENISRNLAGECTSTLKNSTTVEEVSMITDILDEDEESVIPVDDEDDDKLPKESTEQNRDTQTIQAEQEMFSHLQPTKSTDESQNNNNEILNEQEPMEDDNDDSRYLQDESNIFQYPLMEVGRRLWPSSKEQQHFTKGCIWSPDGTCLLVPVHLDGMHIVELPTDLYTKTELNVSRKLSELKSAVHVKEGGTVYDCCWYPYMSSEDPASCCWLATRQHEPIHMWDAFTGDLRCSYRGYDDVDEVETAISIVFSNDGQKVIGGYKKTIKIFDTNIPGRDCSKIPIKQAVSCFALTTENDNCVTAGTWTGYIKHYDLRAPKLGPLFTLGGHQGGITWLKYSPTIDQNWYLFSGARRDNKILQWDMRNYKQPLQVFERNVQTNQRIYFDLTPLHTWLATGDTEGLLRVWSLSDKENCFEIPIHQDCCNAVSIHPSLPIISTTSGQYHFVDVSETEETTAVKYIDYENSLLMFWYGPSGLYET